MKPNLKDRFEKVTELNVGVLVGVLTALYSILIVWCCRPENSTWPYWLAYARACKAFVERYDLGVDYLIVAVIPFLIPVFFLIIGGAILVRMTIQKQKKAKVE